MMDDGDDQSDNIFPTINLYFFKILVDIVINVEHV